MQLQNLAVKFMQSEDITTEGLQQMRYIILKLTSGLLYCPCLLQEKNLERHLRMEKYTQLEDFLLAEIQELMRNIHQHHLKD
ncbi:MAG: hypothetical protein BAA01_09445 [Bacillus thermozeamaize]|uniref:Uncharacterized protein n=1 Tax=Bacillus thermozeamaize TaxID=230954 RepID=A0A1Y3PEC2_9BACI|nr:MAG: hypothetical protein BAA01_09445 [Bacillus thermozeamaize]